MLRNICSPIQWQLSLVQLYYEYRLGGILYRTYHERSRGGSKSFYFIYLFLLHRLTWRAGLDWLAWEEGLSQPWTTCMYMIQVKGSPEQSSKQGPQELSGPAITQEGPLFYIHMHVVAWASWCRALKLNFLQDQFVGIPEAQTIRAAQPTVSPVPALTAKRSEHHMKQIFHILVCIMNYRNYTWMGWQDW